MKWKRNIPDNAEVALALSVATLIVTITVGLIVRLLSNSQGTLFPNTTRYPLIWMGIFSLVMCGLIALKSLADRRYQAERDLLEAFLEHIPDNVFFKDRNSRFLRISRAMAHYCGLAHPSEAVNKTDFDVFSLEHASRVLADEKDIMHTGESLIGVEEKETWPDGRESWVLTTKVPLKDRRGLIIGTMGISHNITERKQAEAKIQYMALHDTLTGLPNRVLLEDRLRQAISIAARNKTQVAVLIFDLDRFRHINDIFGHKIGDRLLQAVSARLRGCLRDSDVLARLGGDEFIVGAPISDNAEGAECVVQKILAELNQPFQIDEVELRVSGSVGACIYPSHGETSQALIQSADMAMYEAKKIGRGVYRLFTGELTLALRIQRNVENDLIHACDRNEFALYYQPLISTITGRVSGVEALLRWNHPVHGLIPPDQFIPQLEEMGMMVEVGRWVLREACVQNKMWQREGLAHIRVAVNVSAQQFYRSDIVNTTRGILSEAGLDAEYLELELTETLSLDTSDNSVSIMRDLKSIGVGLSLDDFGTGWSSLSYLTRFPLDRLKIDRSFMRDIATSSAARGVVGSIINLGSMLRLDCVGEGVETLQQLKYLREQRCAEIQGFLYSPPLPAHECGMFLRSGAPQFEDVG